MKITNEQLMIALSIISNNQDELAKAILKSTKGINIKIIKIKLK